MLQLDVCLRVLDEETDQRRNPDATKRSRSDSEWRREVPETDTVARQKCDVDGVSEAGLGRCCAELEGPDSAREASQRLSERHQREKGSWHNVKVRERKDGMGQGLREAFTF